MRKIFGDQAKAQDEYAEEQSRERHGAQGFQIPWLCVGEVRKRPIYPYASAIPGQSKEKAERANEAESREECETGDGERQSLHSRMDGLFLRRRHEANPAKLE
ncbi:hypothetical protein D3C73_895210 [compost metagenome]